MRSDAPERQHAIGAAEHEWHQHRTHLEHAIGSAEAHIGSQEMTIDDQRNIISHAEGYVADLNARAGGELNAATSVRIDAKKEYSARQRGMRMELAEARRTAEPERATFRDLLSMFPPASGGSKRQGGPIPSAIRSAPCSRI